VVSSHAWVANATLPGHKQRGWDSLRHDLFFFGKNKGLAAFSKKDSEKSNDKRGA
jgi:hypothetical protein